MRSSLGAGVLLAPGGRGRRRDAFVVGSAGVLLAPGGRGRVGGADGAAVLQREPDGRAVVAAHGVAVVQPRPDPEPVDGGADVQLRADDVSVLRADLRASTAAPTTGADGDPPAHRVADDGRADDGRAVRGAVDGRADGGPDGRADADAVDGARRRRARSADPGLPGSEYTEPPTTAAPSAAPSYRPTQEPTSPPPFAVVIASSFPVRITGGLANVTAALVTPPTAKTLVRVLSVVDDEAATLSRTSAAPRSRGRRRRAPRPADSELDLRRQRRQDCAWVAEKPDARCAKVGGDGETAADACCACEEAAPSAAPTAYSYSYAERRLDETYSYSYEAPDAFLSFNFTADGGGDSDFLAAGDVVDAFVADAVNASDFGVLDAIFKSYAADLPVAVDILRFDAAWLRGATSVANYTYPSAPRKRRKDKTFELWVKRAFRKVRRKRDSTLFYILYPFICCFCCGCCLTPLAIAAAAPAAAAARRRAGEARSWDVDDVLADFRKQMTAVDALAPTYAVAKWRWADEDANPRSPMRLFGATAAAAP
ncbi:hypothetical protein JL720_10373 [Aureococcus anophagefferens]|nr:hypothetical protein JL720_10373 [Aureococcus anophagefferens]